MPEVILSSVIAICTLAYTIINYRLLKENKRTREQKITPHIIAMLRTTEDHQTLALFIKNIGEGVAQNVRAKILKDYNQYGKERYPLSKSFLFKNGAQFFPSQYEAKYYLNAMTDIEDIDDENNSVRIEINYERIDGKKYSHIYNLPFNQLINQNHHSPPDTYIGKIPHYLKEIHKTLKVLANNTNTNG